MPVVNALLRLLRPLCRLVIVVLAMAGTPVGASPLPGAEEPAFAAALQDWLADDEAAALPALAELAQSGNRAAQLLLALIDKTPSLQGPFLALRSRGERIALLRAPGGLSGQSWLRHADDLPLAAAWNTLWTVSADPGVIDRFASLGEPRAAREALVVLAARETPALQSLNPDEGDPDLLYLLWGTADADRRAGIAARVPPGDPQRLLMGDTLSAQVLDTWLASATAAAPLDLLCRAVCPAEDDRPPCRNAAYRALNSHNALLTLGTPAETLVPQTVFLDSPRGRSATMRRILLSRPMRGRRALLSWVQGQSTCLGTALSTENRRYHPAIGGSN